MFGKIVKQLSRSVCLNVRPADHFARIRTVVFVQHAVNCCLLLLFNRKDFTWIFVFFVFLFPSAVLDYPQCIISFTADSILRAAVYQGEKSPSRWWKIFWQSYRLSYSCQSSVPIEFSVITSASLLCILVAGCGVCKRMQPIFQQAATETKGKYVSVLNLPLSQWAHCCVASPVSDLQPSHLWCSRIKWDVSAANVRDVKSAKGTDRPNKVFPAGCVSCKDDLSGTVPDQLLHHVLI